MHHFMSHADLTGREFDWFAKDEFGAIALFSTAGLGDIPVIVIENHKAYDAISDSLESPNFGTVTVWNDFAAQGLYVFDWNESSRCYRRLAIPSCAINENLALKISAIPNLITHEGSYANQETVSLDAGA